MTQELLKTASLRLKDEEKKLKTYEERLKISKMNHENLKLKSHEMKLKLNSSKKEFSKVAKQYKITLELLNRYQTLNKTLNDFEDSLLIKTTEANKLIQSSKEISNQRHILQ